MPTKSSPAVPYAKNIKPAAVPKQHHYIRMFFAAVFGTIALSLILASILVVWLNRTLTDTNTYVRTVAPLVTKPEIQNFLAGKATDALIKGASPADIAETLLPAADIAGKTPDQLQAAVRDTITAGVLQIVQAPDFQTQWRETNRTAHAQLVSQLATDSSQLTIDLSPLVTTTVAQLKTTKLAPVSDKIVLPQNAGKLSLEGSSIGKAHRYYRLFKQGTLVLVGVTLIASALSIWISVEHIRTLRRILVGTGMVSLLLALALQARSLVRLSGTNPVDQRAALAFAGVLVHDLQIALVIIGVICVILAVGSKFYSRHRATN